MIVCIIIIIISSSSSSSNSSSSSRTQRAPLWTVGETHMFKINIINPLQNTICLNNPCSRKLTRNRNQQNTNLN